MSSDGARANGNRSPERFEVDGLTPARVERLDDVSKVADVLRSATADGTSVIPWGGGSQMGLGNIPAGYDLALDLSAMDEVFRYESDDMTLSLAPGCRLAEINRLLGERQQMLPVDAADPERATIGGLVAAGVSGPRRLGYGPLRDLIIGIAVAYPDGTTGKAGGQVVKNVTGYDMMRLHHGALGSLGVIVGVNLKAIPKPPSQRAICAGFGSHDSALGAAMRVRMSQLGATALVVLDPATTREISGRSGDGRWTVLTRAEAPPSAVERQAMRLGDALRESGGEVWTVDDPDETEALWVRVSTCLSSELDTGEIAVRIGCAPSRLSDFVRRIDAGWPEIDGDNVDATIMLDVGSGLAYLRLTSPERAEEWAAILETIQGLGDHATILTAPASFKRDIDVFGSQPAGFSIMRALKEKFDPDRRLNGGRFIGRL